MSAVQIIKIDDRDPSVIRSPGDWSNGGNGNEYLGTTSRTNRLGASLQIPFHGTKISVFGTIDSALAGQTPTSLFSVDGNRATQFTGMQLPNAQVYQTKFYDSPDLGPGPHTLLITISAAPSLKASFTFDWAEITDDKSEKSVGSSVIGPSSSDFAPSSSIQVPISDLSSSQTVLHAPSLTTNPSTLSQTPTPDLTFLPAMTTILSQGTLPSVTVMTSYSFFGSSSTHGPFSPLPTTTSEPDNRITTTNWVASHASVIAGASIGCFLLFLLLLCISLFLKRRRILQKELDPEICDTMSTVSPMETEAGHITPFILSPRMSNPHILAETNPSASESDRSLGHTNVNYTVSTYFSHGSRSEKASEKNEDEYEDQPPRYDTTIQ